MTTTPSSPQRIAVLSESASARLSVSNKFLGAVIFLYWLTYENVIFFYPRRFAGTGFVVLTYGLKLLLPFVILYVIGLPSRVISRGPTRYYLVFFSAFLLWSLVPTVVSGDVVTWAKLLPRYVFFLSALGLCARRPAVFALFAKCVVIYVLSALLQYILLTTTGPYQTRETVALLAGPFRAAGQRGVEDDVARRANLDRPPLRFLERAQQCLGQRVRRVLSGSLSCIDRREAHSGGRPRMAVWRLACSRSATPAISRWVARCPSAFSPRCDGSPFAGCCSPRCCCPLPWACWAARCSAADTLPSIFQTMHGLERSLGREIRMRPLVIHLPGASPSRNRHSRQPGRRLSVSAFK